MTNIKELIKDEYHYPNEVVYMLHEEITKLKAALKREMDCTDVILIIESNDDLPFHIGDNNKTKLDAIANLARLTVSQRESL